MFKQLMIAVSLGGFAMSAMAFGTDPIVNSVDLRDGTTVHVFKDGKMAMENAYGRVTGMAEGHVMESKSGEKIVMKGNETARLELSLRPQYLY